MAMGLTETDFFKPFDKKITICLGYFDSVHKGHRALIARAAEISRQNGSQCFVLTFKNNIFPLLGRDDKLVFTYEERLERFSLAGADGAVYIQADSEFLKQSPDEFLKRLECFDLAAVVCGEDYTFGKNGEGNASTLKTRFEKSGVSVEIFETVAENGKKISSSDIRRALCEGDLPLAASLMGGNYFLLGKVVNGRKDGRKIGFPTANTNFPSDKLPPKAGVYVSRVEIDGKTYASMTNVGAQPTFGQYGFKTETNVFGCDGDFYGKLLKVEFLERIRDVRRFSSVEELVSQLKADKAYALKRSGL